LQANAQASSTVVMGPMFDKDVASNACAALAAKSPGVGYIIVMTVGGFATDAPQAMPLDVTSQPGQPVIQG
jgi:hypothetical protein